MIKSFKSLKSISSIHLTIHSGQHEGRPAQVVDADVWPRTAVAVGLRKTERFHSRVDPAVTAEFGSVGSQYDPVTARFRNRDRIVGNTVPRVPVEYENRCPVTECECLVRRIH